MHVSSDDLGRELHLVEGSGTGSGSRGVCENSFGKYQLCSL